jgi:hypothetical protein
MKHLIIIFAILALCAEMDGQQASGNLLGTVTFITPQNVYVKFKSTEGLTAGDTLFIPDNGKLIPVLTISNLSSTSCICTLLSAKNLTVSQVITAKSRTVAAKMAGKPVSTVASVNPPLQANADTAKKKSVTNDRKQKINGSLAAYSYSSFSNTPSPSSTQLRYTFNLNARNIGDSKFSINTYASFRHKIGDWSAVKNDIFNALKIYDLSVTYDPARNTHISIGRKINYNISNIGAMDGLQFEQSFNRFGFGVAAGFRPSFNNYGFDSKLFQYGAYLALNSKPEEIFHQTSIAVMEQMNNSKTDRRFLYFQHTNMLIKNLYFFGTMEADLYTVKNNKPQNTFDLTSLYLSLRLNVTKNLSLTGSYDARKNVTYYETYKSLLDSVLINQTRQSIRLQINYRIKNNIMIGVQTDYRYLKTDPAPTRNVYGYFTYGKIPGIGISATLSGTYLESAFLRGKVLQARLSRDLLQGRFQADLGYQYVDYQLPESKLTTLQHIGEVGLYWQFAKKMSFSVNFEGTLEKKNTYDRIYMQLRKRF